MCADQTLWLQILCEWLYSQEQLKMSEKTWLQSVITVWEAIRIC